jgi:hypothetical protein
MLSLQKKTMSLEMLDAWLILGLPTAVERKSEMVGMLREFEVFFLSKRSRTKECKDEVQIS